MESDTESAEKGTTYLTSDNGDFDVRSELEQLKIGQATQAATLAGAQATQAATTAGIASTNAAAQAGMVGTWVAGSVGFIVGIFLGILLVRSR